MTDLPHPVPVPSLSGHTRFVRLMRYGLPVAALGLVGMVIAWPGLYDRNSAVTLAVATGGALTGDAAMVNPRFSGTGGKGKPFRIVGERATQDPENRDLVTVTKPSGNMTLGDGSALTVTAETGQFDNGKKTLSLEGGVTAATAAGHRFQAGAVDVDLDQETLVSRTPVTADGPAGQIAARGFRVENGGDVLHFSGGVKAIIRPGAQGERP